MYYLKSCLGLGKLANGKNFLVMTIYVLQRENTIEIKTITFLILSTNFPYLHCTELFNCMLSVGNLPFRTSMNITAKIIGHSGLKLICMVQTPKFKANFYLKADLQ